jgi:hypothetical protein
MDFNFLEIDESMGERRIDQIFGLVLLLCVILFSIDSEFYLTHWKSFFSLFY